ncbi:hypothetical protein XENOCAPTIV_024490, partial [Xenoophorus captivus]
HRSQPGLYVVAVQRGRSGPVACCPHGTPGPVCVQPGAYVRVHLVPFKYASETIYYGLYQIDVVHHAPGEVLGMMRVVFIVLPEPEVCHGQRYLPHGEVTVQGLSIPFRLYASLPCEKQSSLLFTFVGSLFFNVHGQDPPVRGRLHDAGLGKVVTDDVSHIVLVGEQRAVFLCPRWYIEQGLSPPGF